MGMKIVRVDIDFDEAVNGKFEERLTKSTKVAVRNLDHAQQKAIRKMFGNGQEVLEWEEELGKPKKHRINYSKYSLRHLEVLAEED